MAAVIEGDVKKNLLDRTEAEKVFRPWWDTLEDYLLNILIVIGKYIFGAVLHHPLPVIESDILANPP